MKIFISQPMRGLTDEQIKEHRQTAIDYLQRRFPGCEIIDSFFEGEANPDNPLELLGRSIQMLNGVDAIYMLRGWQNARGCMTEHDIAWRYNIGVIYEDQEDCKDTQKLFKEAEELDETIPYIQKNKLDTWTHNKTIQKAIESYRITDETKEYLRGLKIKSRK